MCCTIYANFRNRQHNFRKYIFLFVFKMPFYAVVNGRVPGVYRSWEECQNQTKGFPKAKYKKFISEADAVEYIRTNNVNSSNAEGDNDLLSPSTSLIIENLNPPEMKALGKYSSQTLLKQDKLSVIAEKLDDFIEKTNKKLNEFSERLNRLERSFSNSRESLEGKRKSDLNSELEEWNDSTNKRNKTTNGEEDESDWGGDHNVSLNGFLVGPDGFTIVYTDGACTNNGKRGAKAGVGVWFNHNHPFNVAAPVEGIATNNNAEIQAARRAIDQAVLAGIRRLNIHTDSQFMISCMTDWIKKWKRNNWVTSTGGPVKNKEQLVLLDNAIQRLEAVKWTHVRGHMGNVGNECADALAVRGATMYRLG